MAIRVFLNRWTEQQDGDLLYIKDPIDDYLNDVSLSAPVVSMNCYARIALSKRPDRVYLIKVMRGNLQEAEWTELGNLTGVKAVPPFRFNAPTTNVSTSMRNRIFQALDALGIPRTTFTSAPTIGNFLRNLLTELDGGARDFGSMELEVDEWA